MIRSLWVLAACLLTAGCGSYGSVKGTVFYQGKKLEFGSVMATARNGNFTSPIDAEGKYELKGMSTGKINFYVVCTNPKTADTAQELLKKQKEPGAGGGGGATGRGPRQITKSELTKAQMDALRQPSLIPQKYGDMSQNLLTYDLASGDNNYDIDLKP